MSESAGYLHRRSHNWQQIPKKRRDEKCHAGAVSELVCRSGNQALLPRILDRRGESTHSSDAHEDNTAGCEFAACRAGQTSVQSCRHETKDNRL
jgi:hypothetical protein